MDCGKKLTLMVLVAEAMRSATDADKDVAMVEENPASAAAIERTGSDCLAVAHALRGIGEDVERMATHYEQRGRAQVRKASRLRAGPVTT